MAIGSPEVSEIYIVGPIWRYMNEGNLKPSRSLYPFCTNSRLLFLDSASLKLPFDINIALVQTRYHADRKPGNFGSCIVGPIWRYMNPGNLKPRRGWYPFCTRPKIIFFGSASLNLPLDINAVLVQTWYHGDRKPRNFENLHCQPNMATHECG